MDAAEVSRLLAVQAVQESSMLNLYGPEVALCSFLYKLKVIGARRISYSMAYILTQGNKFKEPSCAMKLASVSLNVEYIQFCPKRMADEEFRNR